MKRDFDLIRKVLFFFEEKQGAQHVEVPPIEGYNDSTIKGHLILLYEAGFLRCENIKSSTSDRIIYVIPFDLTWNGHEFLDKIRDRSIWGKVKGIIESRGGSLAFHVINELATKFATELVLKSNGAPA